MSAKPTHSQPHAGIAIAVATSERPRPAQRDRLAERLVERLAQAAQLRRAGHEIDQRAGRARPREQDEPDRDQRARGDHERRIDAERRDADDREARAARSGR